MAEDVARCDAQAERPLDRAAKASSRVARIANLDMAAIYAARSERLRRIMRPDPR